MIHKRLTQRLILFSLALACAFTSIGKSDQVAFDDFEGLALEPFTLGGWLFDSGGPIYSKAPRAGTPREWTLDNSGMDPNSVSLFDVYEGWSSILVDIWILDEGVQIGRGTHVSIASGNELLLADPDAWDDFQVGATQPGYNSYISREYDFDIFDETSATIEFDYEFGVFASQRGTVEVSFDGGTTWQMLLDLDSTTLTSNTVVGGNASFSAGADFAATSNNMILRFGCLTAGNDWWFAIDNIDVQTADGFVDFEDFTGTSDTRLTTIIPAGDGTDFTQDITNWTIDNSQMQLFSSELAFDGWAVLDVSSWIEHQAIDEGGRSFFTFLGANNSVLVADPDAADDVSFEITDLDMDGNPPKPDNAFNSYIYRGYSMCEFLNASVQISFDYEFKALSDQLGKAEVSFDGGATWQTILELDSAVIGDDVIVTDSAVVSVGSNSGQGTQAIATAPESNSMILRFCCLDGGNDWWFGIDNVLIEADPGAGAILGDANGDTVVDFNDIEPLVLALFDRAAYEQLYPGIDADCVLDINGDGQLDFGDIEPFVDLLFN